MSKYDSIINMSRPKSRHAAMSMHDRAAQFSPFAALTGHGAAVEEAARLTDKKVVLSDEERFELDRKFVSLKTQLRSKPKVRVVYFLPDATKDGGRYASYTGHARSIDELEHLLVFAEGETIGINDISSLDILQS